MPRELPAVWRVVEPPLWTAGVKRVYPVLLSFEEKPLFRVDILQNFPSESTIPVFVPRILEYPGVVFPASQGLFVFSPPLGDVHRGAYIDTPADSVASDIHAGACYCCFSH
jgi:hypothetical protein